MHFEWDEDQLAFQGKLREFASTITDDVVARDNDSEFSEEAWQRCAGFGVQGMHMPRQFGGQEVADIRTAILGMEGLGYGCRDGGLLLALNAQMWSVQLPILHFGTDEQKERFLPPLCNGTWKGAHGITEPGTGSDVFNMQTTATRTEGGYILNGTKCLVTLAPLADVALVVATVDSSKGKWGISTFLLERGFGGFSIGENQLKMGLKTVPIGGLHMENCFVPESHRLGAEGSGFATFNHSLEFERCCILASQVGTMQYQLEKAIKYVRERKQFGQPIGKFQSVSNRIADMKVRLETSRLLLYKVAWLKSQGRSAMLEAAMLKLHLSECFLESSMDLVRVHGGQGYLNELDVERDLRDAVGGVLYAGTSDIQRNIIAGLTGV
ncbi:MAG: acyl-CoA dehydrogenase family protein [Planctomycetaceae bacterium]